MKYKTLPLLFILSLSINALHGMKRNLEPEKYFPLNELTIEAKAVVIQMIHTYDNLDDIITTIDATKCINKQFNGIVKNVYSNYNNLKEFTTLVHILSDRFPKITTEAIANKLKIPVRKKYIDLSQQLLQLSGTRLPNTLNNTMQIIADGADVNFTKFFPVNPTTEAYHILTPLFFAMQMKNFELALLLMSSGIKEKTIDSTHETLEKIQKARLELIGAL